MAAAHVQTVQIGTDSGNTLTSPSMTLTAGNAVIVTLMWDTSAGGAGTVTQGAGDTLTLTSAVLDNSAHYTQQWLCHSVAGGATTFTMNWTNNQKTRMFVTEVSGLATSSAFDKFATQTVLTNVAVPSGTTATLAQADEFALATWNADASGSTSLSSLTNGFTCPTNGNMLTSGAGAGTRGLIAYLVTAATTGIGTTLNTADATLTTGLIGTYKAAAGGGGADLSVSLVEPSISVSVF